MNGQRILLVLLLSCVLFAAGCGGDTTAPGTNGTTAAGSGTAGGPGSAPPTQPPVGASTVAVGAAAAPPAKTLSTQYLAKEFQGVVVIHPQQIMKSDLYALATKVLAQAEAERTPETFLEEMQREMGMDPRTIEEVVLAGGILPGGGEQRRVFGGVFRFNKPYDRDAVLAKIPTKQPTNVGAHKVYANDGAALCPVDDKTIIVAGVGFRGDAQGGAPGQINKSVDVIRSMLSSQPSSTLAKALKTLDTSKDVAAIGVLDDQTKAMFVEAAMAQGGLQPQQLQQLQEFRSISAYCDLSAETMFSLNIDVGNDQTAKQLVQQAAPMVQQFTNPQFLRLMLSGNPNLSKETVDDIVGLLGDVAAGHKFEATGGSAVLTLKRPSDLTARIEKIAAPLIARAAKEAKLGNNLREIGLALLKHELTHTGVPAAAILSADGKPLLSWRVAILPFLGDEAESLHKEFKLDEPWDSEHNKKLISRMPAAFACGISPEEGKSNMLAIVGLDTVWDYSRDGQVIPLGAVVDGTLLTAMVVQVTEERAVPWTKPEEFRVNPEDVASGLGLKDEETFAALFCDGSVHFLSKRTKPDTIKAIFTRNGGEDINVDNLK